MKRILMAATLLIAGQSLAQERTIYNDFVTFQQAQDFWPDLKMKFMKSYEAPHLLEDQKYSSIDLSRETVDNFDSFNQSKLLEKIVNDLSGNQDSIYFNSGNDGVGNGGGSWVCLEGDGKTIRWSKMVDLDEAENELLLTMKDFGKRSTKEIVDLIKIRLFSMSKVMYNVVLPHLSNVQQKMKVVDRNLNIIDDALVRSTPPNSTCETDGFVQGAIQYIQLANYTDYGAILVNKRVFENSTFNDVSKAALIWHEAIYAFMREQFGDTNSVHARAIVGYLFSDLPNEKILAEIKKFMGPFTFEDTNSFGMKFANIPAGRFEMGDDRAENSDINYPRTYQNETVIKKPFLMMTTEVTQEQWLKVMGSNPSNSKGAKKPVENIEWSSVQSFINKLNIRQKLYDCEKLDQAGCYRLPTSEEWEYAARAGTQTAYFFGESSKNLEEYAWTNSPDSHEVAQKKANPFGLYDIYGNVGEWAVDKSYDLYGRGDAIQYLIRGGSIRRSSPDNFRSASKIMYNSRPSSYNDVGLRLVRVIRNNIVNR